MVPFLEQLGIPDDGSKTVELSAWQHPTRVELLEDRLVPLGGPKGWKSVGSNRAGLLVRFARLADVEDEAIRRFAQTWGMLDLCGHDQPRTHSSAPTSQLGHDPGSLCPLPRSGPPGEPVDIWRTYAGQAGAFLVIHQCLLDGTKTTPAMWEPLRPLFPGFFEPPDAPPPRRLREVRDYHGRAGTIGPIRISIPTLREARPAVAYAVRRWMALGAVGVRFEWTGSIGTITFGGQSLFGALATLVAVTLSGADGPILCSHCRLPYNPSRKPRGPRHFCEECREDGQPQKYAKRDFNNRNRPQADPPG